MTRRAGQLLIAGFDGLTPGELLERIAAGRLAGVILFSRNIESLSQLRALTGALHAAAPEGRPILIGIDQEGGRVQRLREPLVRWPTAAALGKRDDVSLTHQVGEAMGADLAALGINVDFAPVLDVLSAKTNTVIGDRAFGVDPVRVTRHGMAFAAGLARGGVLSCGKHFPGHGGEVADSHLELPVDARTRKELMAVDLPPFVAAARERIPLIMVAHVVYPAFDAELPATKSSAIVDGLLRGALAYEGVICSDDMEMGAIARYQNPAEAVLEGLRAGIDLFLICHQRGAQLEAEQLLARAADENARDARRLGHALARVDALRASLNTVAKSGTSLEELLAPTRHEQLLRRLAELG